MNTYNNVLELVGDTPLVKLNKITHNLKGSFYAKLEWFNPGLSVKDRVALYIIEKAEKEGRLKPGSTVCETTSGNTGFAVAMVCRIKGYKCILAVSDKTGPQKIAYLQAMGAKVYVCPANVPADDPKSYYETAKRIAKETPNSIYINQYFNEENIAAHHSTGKEIWEQTDGKVTHVVICSGTGGTISGVGRYLKEKNPNIRILGVDAYGSAIKKYHETGELDSKEIYPYKIEGLGKNLIPSATDFSVVDRYVKVTDEDAAYKASEVALTEGLFIGYTGGAVTQGLFEFEDEFDENSVVVTVYPDHGSKYMDRIYNKKWMEKYEYTNHPLQEIIDEAKIEYIEEDTEVRTEPYDFYVI
ncbi:cystathionine beta-synthase [Flavobacteriaceae bacterium UJ101]|nr:cystathionine beta-synthase [Flavobacteriaceae bacterium UJ101]